MTIAVAVVLGALFGVGLLISGMTDPAKVIGFLDVAGRWDPSLAFVMGGAILVAAPCFAFARRREKAVLGGAFEKPDRTEVEPRLIIGAAIFGIGWGLSGICPGPGIVLLGQTPSAIWIFLVAVAIGICAATGVERLSPGHWPRSAAKSP